MANATLKVTVNGGTTPLDIQVALFKDGASIDSFSRDRGFTKNFTSLSAGRYTLFVHGFNPPGGNTDIGLSGAGITITSPSTNPVNKKGVGYLVAFKFTV